MLLGMSQATGHGTGASREHSPSAEWTAGHDRDGQGFRLPSTRLGSLHLDSPRPDGCCRHLRAPDKAEVTQPTGTPTTPIGFTQEGYPGRVDVETQPHRRGFWTARFTIPK